MLEHFFKKSGVREGVAETEVEVSDEAITLAKKIVFLSRDPVPGPNPQLESAIEELAIELGVAELDSKAVQQKAYEIERQVE